jgi:U2-associated protein SR140
VFTSDITDKLRLVLDGASAHPAKNATKERPQVASTITAPQSSKALDSSRFKKAGAGGFKSTFVTSVMPVPSAEATPVPAANDEDLDGEAMDQDLDGEVMDEDLDGEAMQDDDDLDGEAMS